MKKYNFSFKNLYDREKLRELDDHFLDFLKNENFSLYEYLLENRKIHTKFAETYANEPEQIIEIAKIFADFLINIFDIKHSFSAYNRRLAKEEKIFSFRKSYINKIVKSVDISTKTLADFFILEKTLLQLLSIKHFSESIFVDKVNLWLTNLTLYSKELEVANLFSALVISLADIPSKYKSKSIFFKAKKVNFAKLVTLHDDHARGYRVIAKNKATKSIKRNGFSLYTRSSLRESLHNSNYCVKCHKRGRDYCKKGDVQDNIYKSNPSGVELKGCPLSMHISQMHVLNEQGNILAALIVATINNPLLAATGYNICNDCSVSCIFQKQETVDTPKVESHILKEVLALPWGFEIYSLLSRFNPLRFYRPYPKESSSKKVLVVGLGPAGYSLAYSLLQEGHYVVAIDALKIEPLNVPFSPIIDLKTITEDLDSRVINGFGGVSEYGITSRWDKNFLKIIRIILEREANMKIYGGLIFGSNISFQDAYTLGFNHVALCCGAGKPNLLPIENILAKGVRTSSDFLMSLHLGAFKKNNFHNLSIRFPVVVLGGGLTALDCATEAAIYYQRQLEKHLSRYNNLDKEKFNSTLEDEDRDLLAEYIRHFMLLEQAKSSSKDPYELVSELGGVSILYHGSFEDSKAYKGNPSEVEKTLRQGVSFIENAKLLRINIDRYSSINSLDVEINGSTTNIPARTLILALGTNQNNVVLQENPDLFSPDEANFTINGDKSNKFKDKEFSVILKKLLFSKDNEGYWVSFFGDMHKEFSGSVVKAMASAFYGQYEINKVLEEITSKEDNFPRFINTLEQKLFALVHDIKDINSSMYEIIIKSPLLTNKIKAGQFIKVQNYESYSKYSGKDILLSESIMLTPIVFEGDYIKCVVMKNGASTEILSNIEKNTKILCSGPLGSATSLPSNKAILLIAEGISNINVIAILKEAKKRGNTIFYIGIYKDDDSILYADFISKYVQKSHYLKVGINSIISDLPQVIDEFFKDFNGNLDMLMLSGSYSMVGAVNHVINTESNADIIRLLRKTEKIVSLSAPMLCGLKGVCATCLQKDKHNNFFYCCAVQEKNIEDINFINMGGRLMQNSLQEKIAKAYYEKTVKNKNVL